MTKAEQTRLMAWRFKILQRAAEASRNVASTCRHFEISRKTFYKWKRRHDGHSADKLAAFDARKSRVIELRYFVGVSLDEMAQMLQISRTTVDPEWRTAHARLHQHVTEPTADRPSWSWCHLRSGTTELAAPYTSFAMSGRPLTSIEEMARAAV